MSGAGRGRAAHLVEDHLSILRVSRRQEHLLAFLIDLINARGQVCRGRAGEWGERVSGASGSLGPGPGEGVPTGLTQDAHVVFALPLVGGNKVVKGVGEVLEECVLLVHLQPQDAVQELADGAVCGWQGASGYVQAASLSPPLPSYLPPPPHPGGASQ